MTQTATQPTGGAQPPPASQVRQIAERRRDEPGPLLEVLHDVQRARGWISDEDVVEIADVLNVSVADVHGVVSFYHDFRRTPPPAHTVQVCRAEACQSVGAEALHREVVDALADRDDVEVTQVFCFGNCALGPSVALDGRLRGRMSAERVLGATKEWTS